MFDQLGIGHEGRSIGQAEIQVKRNPFVRRGKGGQTKNVDKCKTGEYHPAMNFWSKVRRSGKNNCWLWTGAKNKKGYGCLYIRGTQVGAHRVAWTVPKGLYVLHRCDTPGCVNPKHLYAGTQSQNIKDAVRRGRFSVNVPRGDNHNSAKLNEKLVVKIYHDPRPNKVIAAQYGVRPLAIWSVKARRTWRYVNV